MATRRPEVSRMMKFFYQNALYNNRGSHGIAEEFLIKNEMVTKRVRRAESFVKRAGCRGCILFQ